MMDERSVGDDDEVSNQETETAHIQFKPEHSQIQDTKPVQLHNDDHPGSPPPPDDTSFGVIADFLNGNNKTDNEPCSSRHNDVVEELTVVDKTVVGQLSFRARLEINRRKHLNRLSLDGDSPTSSKKGSETSTADLPLSTVMNGEEANPLPVEELNVVDGSSMDGVGQLSFRARLEINQRKHLNRLSLDGDSPTSSTSLSKKEIERVLLTCRNAAETSTTDLPLSTVVNGEEANPLPVEELNDGSSMAGVGQLSYRARLEINRRKHLNRLSLDGDLPSSSLSKNGSESVLTCRNAGETSTKDLPLSTVVNGEANPLPVGGIKTKMLSQSGFSQFFVKKTLKGKGVTLRGPPHKRSKASDMDHQQTLSSSGSPLLISNHNTNHTQAKVIPLPVADDVLPCLPSKPNNPSSCASPSDRVFGGGGGGDTSVRGCGGEGLSLRDWFKSERQEVNKAESLHIFRQIVELVDDSYSQGVALCDLRPSSFKISKEKSVKYVGSGFQRDTFDGNMNKSALSQLASPVVRRRLGDTGFPSSSGIPLKKQKLSGPSSKHWPMFQRAGGVNIQTENDDGARQELHLRSSQPQCSTAPRSFTSMSEKLEEKWYASPEELRGEPRAVASNIYSLGILLFELLSQFQCERAREAAMSDIRHRILPPKFLSENPKEAGFCLWLLHPEPSCRPSTRDILLSEVVNGIPDLYAEGLSLAIEQEDTESEVLQHFLVLSQEQRQKHAGKLMEDIGSLEADIEEIVKRRCAMRPMSVGEASNSSPASGVPEMRLVTNIKQLETAYFGARIDAHLPEARYRLRSDRDLLRNRDDNVISEQENSETWSSDDRVGAFFDGLCKYARYSKFETRGVLRTGELTSNSNVICSLGFDRDEDYFATAGVSKKIKIFEFNSLFNESVDIHYPAVEMPNRSKLSGVCWNNYIRNYLASSDYDGIVKLWDVTTGQAISHFIEHEKRAWSVDFADACPTKLASGSDDCSVKLWNINERNCLGTIKSIANVCCVQFSPESSHLLAFGSSDFRTYCYDLRNLRVPWCILSGHNKAVSYAKFLDSETLVTASTDNTLKLWDLKKTAYGGLSTNACSLTFGGHTNEKNFVGLSTADGYIACGSETNEVYAYHRSLPMPITSYKFGSIDPISGKEIEEDNNLFVSSVCWRKRSNMVVSASSNGSIKVLQLV